MTDSKNRFEQIRVRGVVQGVGFRPQVWRLAERFGVRGDVRNDAQGVLIRAWGDAATLDRFAAALESEPPPLAAVAGLERVAEPWTTPPDSFAILQSDTGSARTGVSADAAVCSACLDDTFEASGRRYRYPFTNCTHCGPRFSIIKRIPYDRVNTSMAGFEMCRDCLAEFREPANRRFHAQPNACPVCGPRTELRVIRGPGDSELYATATDDLDAVAALLKAGHIVAIKGLGGFHLACDATNEQVVQRLRERKRRYHKPFALMARDLDAVRRYCNPGAGELALLQCPQAPMVIMPVTGAERVAASVAPRQATLGFMLPYTPLHHLIMRPLDQPIVLTSGNLSEEPQCIDDRDALRRLAHIADYVLLHDRAIVNRVDDTVARVMAGAPRLLRRARGYAPAPLALPAGFEQAPDLLAMGAELKSTLCLISGGQAVLSQHLGDLEDATTYADYRHNLDLLHELYQPRPRAVAVDCHPEYLSTKLGRQRAEPSAVPVHEVQHHHAHVAACMAENGVPLDTQPLLGIALDGLGYGLDGTFWGGEFLYADYRSFERVACLKPVAMVGGTQAMREPWRNTYAHIEAAMGWQRYRADYAELELTTFLESRPLQTLAAMLRLGTHAPLASSCGRLFDAVAAAVGICRQRASYEGQAAIELEAATDSGSVRNPADKVSYRFDWVESAGGGPAHIDAGPMWPMLFDDLAAKTPAAIVAARFHRGLAKALVDAVAVLCKTGAGRNTNRVALTGGVFQNCILLELVCDQLQSLGITPLTHRLVPANDGGIAFGQAVVTAARLIQDR